MMASVENQAARIDARPVRPTSNETSWDKALALRDQFAAEVRGALEREKLMLRCSSRPMAAIRPG